MTQNVDGLHQRTRASWDHRSRLVEAHGRLGLYKCVPTVEQEAEEEELQESIEKMEKKGREAEARVVRRSESRSAKTLR